MKRIKAACICQTFHFMLKENVGHDYAVKLVHQDIDKYVTTLKRSHTRYKIVEQSEQPDGSVMIKIIKQMNMSPVGDYLD